MDYQCTLDDGAHYAMTARDVSDLLDIIHGRGTDSDDLVAVHRVEYLVRGLERGLERIERAMDNDLADIRARRERREPVEWEPADD